MAPGKWTVLLSVVSEQVKQCRGRVGRSLNRYEPEGARNPFRQLIVTAGGTCRPQNRCVISLTGIWMTPESGVMSGGAPTNRCHIYAWQHDDMGCWTPELASRPEYGFDKRLFASTHQGYGGALTMFVISGS